jgi:hypothetical protein
MQNNSDNNLEELRERLLIADANYENATTVAERDAADLECKRLRGELHARQRDHSAVKEGVSGSAQSTLKESPKKKAQAAGE